MEPQGEQEQAGQRGGRVTAGIMSVIMLVAIVAAYALFQAGFFVPGCTEWDSAGYMVLAERIAAGGPLAVAEDDLLLNHGHMWVENERGETIPKFAPGQSLLMAAALRLWGETAAYAVTPFLGALCLAGAYLLIRLWASRAASLLAVFALATNPIYLFYTNYLLSHAADVCCVTWGMYFLWLWARRPGPWSGLGAGLLLGYAQLVRPANALLVLVVIGAAAVTFAAHWRERRFWGGALALSAAYAVFPVLHMAYNDHVYGHVLRTGYALCGEQAAFSWPTFTRNAAYALDVLGGTGLSAYFGLGLVGILAARPHRDKLLRLLWVAPIILLYMSYYWAPRVNRAGYTRFFLAVFPVFVGSAFALLDRVARPAWRARVLCVATCLIVFAARFSDTVNAGRTSGPPSARIQAAVSSMAEAELPQGAVIYAEFPACLRTGREGMFRVYDAASFGEDYVQKAFYGHSGTYVRQQPSRRDRFLSFYSQNRGRLTEVLRERVSSAIAAGREVAFVTPKGSVDHYRTQLGPAFDLTFVSERHVDERWTWGLYRVVGSGGAGQAP